MTRPVVVGVAGGSGSGKSTVVAAVAKALAPIPVTIIPHDAYYRDRRGVPAGERDHLNFDKPDALETDLLLAHLDRLRAGQTVAIPVYDFTTHERAPATLPLEPSPVVLVDGVFVLADPSLRSRLDLAVYVDTAADLRFIRRLLRDTRTRGRTVDSVVEQYLESVRPMHDLHVEPSRARADLVITEGGFNRVAVEGLVEAIRARLRAG